MPQPIRFVLALHNHQPIGNFDGVIEQAYQESYRPFLDVLDRYPHLPFALHTSGSLMEWLAAHRPEYVARLADLVAAGRVEIIGGAYYEPILPMIPRRDRIGQIRSYTQWLEQRLGGRVRGMWIPERVWEQSLVSDLAEAGIEYTILDDFHFKNAGLEESQLHGYYVSEDEGYLLSIFPGSERLRYIVPFASPQETIKHLTAIADAHPGSVVVFGDDGEKFGTWPETHRHVYTNGWLAQFCDALSANRDWIQMTTLSETIDNVPPQGKVYLPDASYREMTEWALPVEQLNAYEHVRHELEQDPRWPTLARFVRGGFWRNFKVKYPESDEMYTRMLMVSRRLEQATRDADPAETIEYARTELYRAQCNCSYWHGAFGGIYLPHLRNAVYNHLIAADNLLDQAAGRQRPWVEALVGDHNLDARQEVYLSSDQLALLLAPARGGQLYELDVRSICLNLLATFTRRPEAYHRKVLAGARQDGSNVASIHDRVIFKQEGLDQRVVYDQHARKSLLDHFFDEHLTLEDVAAGRAMERGDFLTGVYETRLRRSPERIQVVLSRQGNAWRVPFSLTKTITLEAGSPAFEVHYQLEGLPRDRTFHFGVEWNFAALPSGASDRYFRNAAHEQLGHLGTHLDLHDMNDLELVDEYLGIAAGLHTSRPSRIWTFPIETVSQSEGGFELVHQSVAVIPHWIVKADMSGAWSVTLTFHADTSLAASRSEHSPEHQFASL